jgi:toxin ParE1/3/4
MANYKLSKLAKEDLMRIHEYGTRNFGASRAEKYFHAFFDRFEELENLHNTSVQPSFPTFDT